MRKADKFLIKSYRQIQTESKRYKKNQKEYKRMKKDEKGLNRIKKDPKRISKGLQASTCSIHAIAFCSILCYPRYLETLKPWITLLTPLESGPPLRYRCKLCTTNTQPFGKVNVLLPRRSKGIRLNPVKHFMKQHLDSDQHVDALELLAREGN